MKSMMVLDPGLQRRLIRIRRQTGAGGNDEVWDGVYIMSPDPDNLHQRLRLGLSLVLLEAIGGRTCGEVFPGVNVSDRQERWRENFRVPDVAVFLPGNPAQDRTTHWYGGPDFAIEIVSPRDRSRRKREFYARVGVRELLLVDRKPWALELFRLTDGVLEPAGRSVPEAGERIVSTVLPIAFRLLPGTPHPQIEVTRTDGTPQTWLI